MGNKVEKSTHDLEPEFYAITGNHNDWTTEDTMEGGKAPHSYVVELEIPSEGFVEFRFLADGDTPKALGPIEERCTSRTAPVGEIRRDCNTSWVVYGEATDQLRIEL